MRVTRQSLLALFTLRRVILLLREPLRELLDHLLNPPPLLVSRPPADRPACKRASASLIARSLESNVNEAMKWKYAPRTERNSHERAHRPVGRDEHARAEPTDDADARAARDAAQQAAPRARYLTDFLQVVEEGDPLPWPRRERLLSACRREGRTFMASLTSVQ